MYLTSYSHTQNCTVKNALLWGMCRSHIYQVRTQNRLDSRIVHLVLAIIEAIPGIGQVVSLIELKIIQSYTRQPLISSIPQITKVISRKKPTDTSLIWPQDLKLLGLTESQKELVDKHIRNAFRAGHLVSEKKKLKYNNNTYTVEVNFPITLCFHKANDQSPVRVILLPKTIFASGGERKIRWAYDLTTGTFFLKKRIIGAFEKMILNYLLPIRAKRGIQTSILWRTSSGKKDKSKEQIIEPVRDGTLRTLFGTTPLLDFSVKKGLIVDLLADLKDLHDARMSNVTITPQNGAPIKDLAYNAYHSDIKPLNVLVFFQNGRWRAELCDFGSGAAHPSAKIFSIGFTPPEYIRFYQEKFPRGFQNSGNTPELIQFNIQHGRGRDVWSMGLVILSLLVERDEEAFWENDFDNSRNKANIPPLPCLKSILSGRMNEPYEEKGILNLKQETLDADLDKLEREIAPKHPIERIELATIFGMLKRMMLRINPNERKTAAENLAVLEPQQIA